MKKKYNNFHVHSTGTVILRTLQMCPYFIYPLLLYSLLDYHIDSDIDFFPSQW